MNTSSLLMAVGGLALVAYWLTKARGQTSDGLSTAAGNKTEANPVTLNISGPTFMEPSIADGLGMALGNAGLGLLSNPDSGAGVKPPANNNRLNQPQ